MPFREKDMHFYIIITDFINDSQYKIMSASREYNTGISLIISTLIDGDVSFRAYSKSMPLFHFT